MINKLNKEVETALTDHLGRAPLRMDYEVTEAIKELGVAIMKIYYKNELIKVVNL